MAQSERKNRAAAGMSCVPDELLADNILSRLPIKSILQCSCVCKSWRSLVTTCKFVSTHLRNHTEKNKFTFVVKDYFRGGGSKLFLFNNPAKNYFFPPMSLHPSAGLHNQTSPLVVGSVKGLICVSICEHSDSQNVVNLILCNPSIGHFMSIDLPDSPRKDTSSLITWAVQGFGFDKTTQDYKILLIPSTELELEKPPARPAFVYSLNSNSWRSLVISPAPFHCKGPVVFVNGGIHWLGYHQQQQQPRLTTRCIWVFDVKDETFRQISLPQFLLHLFDCLTLMEFGDSSSLAIASPIQPHIRKDSVDIWLMKDYADESSWIKFATIDSTRVFGFIDNDHLLIQFEDDLSGCLVSYNIKKKLNKRLIYPDYSETPGSRFSRVFKYVPSLALLDKPNNINDATFVHITTPPPTTRRDDMISQSLQTY